jgi:alkylhydroperoxidase family enzyme
MQAQLTGLVDWRNSDSFTADQRAALALTDAMTRDVQVDDADFEEAKVLFGVRELTELVTTIAAYNMVSRFLEAMRIHSSDERRSLGRA